VQADICQPPFSGESKMKTITTKYLGATNYRGSRIKASDQDGNSVIHIYYDEMNSEENHKSVAKALCEKMNWFGKLYGGYTKKGMIWVFKDERDSFTVKAKK
jgi:hypothetical protein